MFKLQTIFVKEREMYFCILLCPWWGSRCCQTGYNFLFEKLRIKKHHYKMQMEYQILIRCRKHT